MTDWQSRFRVPLVGFPRWAADAPDRVFFTSTEGGSLQGWAARADGSDRRVIAGAAGGVEHIHADPEGRGLIWWDDPTGDETGRWMLTTFDGASTEPLVADVPAAWSEGIGLAPGVVALGLSDDDGYRILLHRDGTTRELLSSADPIGIGREWEMSWNGLSADGSILCVRIASEHNVQHALLRCYDTQSGELLGELQDPGSHLRICSWSPVDHRLVVLHEGEDLARPAIWNLDTGERTNVSIDVPGEAEVWGWWPDASAILVQLNHLGRSVLYRYEPASGALDEVCTPGGVAYAAAVRPDGEVWIRAENPEHPPRIIRADGSPALEAPAVEAAASSRPGSHMITSAPDGQQIHSMLALPEGKGPFPTVLRIHGGPEWADAYDWQPQVQAFVDAGFAVVMPNYRGSTGQGRAWREGFHSDVGFAEARDVMSVLDDLIAQGITDPRRVAVEGWSWGGYLALLLAGIHPDRFAGAIGGIPVADTVACHEDCSPLQQAYDIAVYGGTPAELPDVYAERSPLTYVRDVRAPVLIIAGEADSRCPIRQVRLYEAAMREHGKDIEVHTYATGHHASENDEVIAHTQMELDFLRTVLG